MGFYTRKNLFNEAVINGVDQDEAETSDYTADEDDDTPANPETTDPPAEEPDSLADDTPPVTEEEPVQVEDPEADYTAGGDEDEPNEGDTTPTDDTTPVTEDPPADDTPTDDAEPQTADDGGEATPEDDTTPTDYTIPDDAEPQTADDGGDNDYTADDDTDTGTNEPAAGDATPTDDSGGETDYTDDGEDGGETGGSEGTDSTGDEDTGGSDDGPSTTAGSINNDLKAKENELFADLTDEQKAIRDIELKGLYAALYDSVDDIINRINNIHKTEYTLDVFEFISTKLAELKTLIHYNLTVTFPTKSYIENQITYQECLAVLNTVEEMLKTVEKSSNSEENS